MRRSLHAAIGAVLGLFPDIARAYSVPDPGIINTCVLPGILSCGNADLASYLGVTIIPAANIAFWGVLAAAIIYYGIRRLFTPDSENALSETRQSFEYAFVGVVLFLGANLIASSFVTWGSVTRGLVEPAGAITVLDGVSVALKAAVGIALLVNIAIQGFRMIVATEEGEVTKARKLFLYGCLGAAIVLLAGSIVTTVFLPSHSTALAELKGIANYIITIFGFLAVLAIVIAGILLIVSFDESMKERSKKLIIASLVSLIVVISAAGLVNFFVFN